MNGVVYVVVKYSSFKFDIDFFQECINSAESIKRYCNTNITLITDCNDFYHDVFDRIKLVNRSLEHPHLLKIKHLINTPYDKTLYLDCDTEVRCNIENEFSLLDGYDFAIDRFFYRILSRYWSNCGVFMFNRNAIDFLNDWYQLSTQKKHESDEIAFNEKYIAGTSDLRIRILDQIYNDKSMRSNNEESIHVSKEKFAKAKIIHCHWLHTKWMKDIIAKKLRACIGSNKIYKLFN